jgi:chaperonin GroES
MATTYKTTDGIAPGLKLEEIVASANLAEVLSKEYLDDLGKCAVEGYKLDRGSRQEWEQRNEKAIKLALQVSEFKNFPWENCSNVKFPLLTIAALQFLARVSTLTKGRHIAKVEALGIDLDGSKSKQAKRVSTHLSLQLIEEDENWVDSDEQAKLAASIVGSAFKKTYYDSIAGVNISEYVPAMNFVVDYHCKDINKTRRATHLIFMGNNAIQERVRQGLFCEMDCDAVAASPEINLLRTAADEAEGLKRPQDAYNDVYEILEQHCWLDLDCDGYEEPYIIYVRLDTMQVMRIVARFFDQGDVHRVNDSMQRTLEEKLREMKSEQPDDLKAQSSLEKRIQALITAKDNHIIRIDPTLYFTRYVFIPSPDGGLYGIGFGMLLGPLNESVNTLVNQLIDGGTMANTAGGFLGRGVKMKGGKTSFDPFEWKPIDSTGDDLRKNIFPLPVREPSAVLFQLLGMLVSYSEKISGATDIMTGVSPGQNTPAETSRNTVEQGMMLFSGIYNRMYRSFKEELRKFYNLNRLYLQSSPKFLELTVGPNAILAKDDYIANSFRVFPAASPEAVSTTQRREKAQVLHQLAASEPGFNRYLVTRNLLEAHDYEEIDQYYPDPKGPNAIAPPANPKVENEKGKLGLATQIHQDSIQLDIASLKNDISLNGAKIMELQAKAAQHLAEADGVATGHQIAMIDSQIGAAKLRQEGLLGHLNAMQKAHDSNMKATQLATPQQGESSNDNGQG